ncbi:MAG: CheR family methyltransferase [Pseudomonadota bacterium]
MKNSLDNKSKTSNLMLREDQYELFRALIQERTGMSFLERRRDTLVKGLMDSTVKAGCENLERYYQFLKKAKTDSEVWDDLIRSFVVGETYFFRDKAQFEALRNHILPELIERNRDSRRLRIWSAGCASGEEPYSLAMLLDQLIPDIAQWNILILGTDINKQSLPLARKGCYRNGSFREMNPVILERYFTPRDRFFELKPQIREMATFAYLNLAEDSYPSLATNTNAMDLILCRNVAIYLKADVLQKMAERFNQCLKPEGWFIVSAAESGSQICEGFESCNFPGAILYKNAIDRAVHADALSPAPLVLPSIQPKPTYGIPGKIPFWPVPSSQPSLPSAKTPIPSPKPAEAVDPFQDGMTLMGQGRYQKAIYCFQSKIAKDPGSISAYYQIARAKANLGQLEEGMIWCRKTIDRDPLMTEAQYTLALIHQEEGQPAKAIDQLKKTLYLDPNYILAHFSLANLYQQEGRPKDASRHRSLAIRLAGKRLPDEVLLGSEGLTVSRLMTMMQVGV